MPDIKITWHDPRPSGAQYCEFWHAGQRVEMKAALCVRKLWQSEVDRDAWAQTNAAAIIERMDNPEPELEEPIR